MILRMEKLRQNGIHAKGRERLVQKQREVGSAWRMGKVQNIIQTKRF
jgi:hypothetical protein